MKKILLTIALASVSLFSQAQFKLGLTGGLGLPIGDFSNVANLGFGGSLHARYLFTPKVAAGVNFGYYAFGGKELMGIKLGNYSIMPITASFEYAFTEEGFKPYVGADLGLYNLSYTSPEISVMGVVVAPSVTVSKMYLGFAPTAGFNLAISDALDWNLNVKYNLILSDPSTFSYLGINTGLFYTFGGK